MIEYDAWQSRANSRMQPNLLLLIVASSANRASNSSGCFVLFCAKKVHTLDAIVLRCFWMRHFSYQGWQWSIKVIQRNKHKRQNLPVRAALSSFRQVWVMDVMRDDERTKLKHIAYTRHHATDVCLHCVRYRMIVFPAKINEVQRACNAYLHIPYFIHTIMAF